MGVNTQKEIEKVIDIKKVIASKNAFLAKAIPGFLYRWVRKILHEDDINEFLAANKGKDPYVFVEAVIERMGVNVRIVGEENIPQDKRLLFSANHPLGGLDGIVFIHVVHKILGEVRFPVNDILLNVPGLKDIFLPINKHGSNSRDALQAMNSAYASDKTILYFPAGMCSRKIDGKIVDLSWKKSVITQARKFERDIIPVHFKAYNSKFFYNLGSWRKKLGIKANLEMFFLIDEMFKQKNKDIVITFGKPIEHQSLDKSKTINEWVAFVRSKTYELDN